MATGIKIKGLSRVARNIERFGNMKAKGIERGLNKAALVVKGESQRIVPIDFGILRSSAFVRKINSGFNTKMLVGYSANYAVYVHENLDSMHKEGTQAKFVSAPAMELSNNGTILRIVLSEVTK